MLDHLLRPELVKVTRQMSVEVKFDLPPRWQQWRSDNLRGLLFSHATRHTTAAVGIYSTRGFGNTRKLDTGVLRDDIRSARQVTVISAYYVPKFLKNLLRQCTDVRVLLNGLGGRRLADQIKELHKLERKLQNSTRNAEIRLAFSRGIFHTKLYLLETRAGPVAWVGSANATEAALGKQYQNEEILARLEPSPPSLLAYTESVWNNGKRLNDCRPSVNSLPAFFRTGDLYYKPYVSNPMTFNPFESLIKGLSDEQQKRLAALDTPDIEPRAGIGAFSIRRPYFRLAVDKSDSTGDDGDDGKFRATIRPYAIETCYGYWVANCFVEKVEAKLDKAAKVKDDLLKGLCEWLIGRGRSETIDAYRNYLRDVRDALVNNKIDLGKNRRRWENAFKSTDRIERRIEMLVENLEREASRKRLTHAFVSQRVPEIWDDIVARSAFEETFFASLAEQSHKSNHRSPAAGRLLQAIDCRIETKPQEIQKKLEVKLTVPGWYDRTFSRVPRVSR